MMDVEELERAMLEGARKELAPSASDRMRIQSRLVGNPAWFLPAPALRPSVLRGLTRSWRGGLALGFAVGALLGFGAARGVERAGHGLQPVAVEGAGTASSDPVRTPALVPEQLAGRELAVVPGVVSAQQLSAREVVAAPDRGGPPRAHGAGASARPARDSQAVEESGSTLARELALLQRARRALNRSDAQLALGIVQSLDERFPNGVLMEERVATRILSLCQLERVQEAREQGHHFLVDHPRSVYAERVRHSCAGGR
jgi:hypothetical protein